MRPLFGLYVIFFYYNVAASSGFTTHNVISDKKIHLTNNIHLEDKENSSTLVSNIDVIHRNSSYQHNGKVNKTLTNEQWINNLIPEGKADSFTLVTRRSKINLIRLNGSDENLSHMNMTSVKNKSFLSHGTNKHGLLTDFNDNQDLHNRTTGTFTNSHRNLEIINKINKKNFSMKPNENKFLHTNFTEFSNSLNQSVMSTNESYIQRSTKKLENKTYISATLRPVNIKEAVNYYVDHKQKPYDVISPAEVSLNIQIFPTKDNETSETTANYEQLSQSAGNVSGGKYKSGMLTTPETDLELVTAGLTTDSETFSQHDAGHTITGTKEHILLINFNNSSQDLPRRTLHQYPESKGKTNKENSSMKSNKNKFSYSNFTDSFYILNQSIANTDKNYVQENSKMLENKTFISVTDPPVNIIRVTNFYSGRKHKQHNGISPVEVSLNTYKKDISPVINNESDEITTSYEQLISHSTGNGNEENYESGMSTIPETTTTSYESGMLTTAQTTIKSYDSGMLTTPETAVIADTTNLTTNSTTFTDFQDIYNFLTTIGSIFFNPFDKTSNIHDTELTTEPPLISINNIKRIKDTNGVTTDVSEGVVTDNTNYYWHSTDIKDRDKKISSNNRNVQYETQGLPTQTTDLTTESNNNQFLDIHATSESQYENNTVMQTISDTDEQSALVKSKNITEINNTDNVSTTGYKSITSKGRVDKQSQMTFLMIPWKSLTNKDLQVHSVTVAFQTTVSSDLWLSSYDKKFRRYIAYVLDEKKTPDDIVYVSPTPISIDGQLLVSFVVGKRIDGNELYEPGLSISQHLNEHKETLETMMHAKINKIQVGFLDILKKDSYCKNTVKIENISSSFSWRHIALTVCATLIIAVILLAIGFYIVKCRRWTAEFYPEPHYTEDNTKLTDREELSQSAHYRTQGGGSNNEAYPLKTLSKSTVNNCPQNTNQEKASTSHNSICTLEVE